MTPETLISIEFNKGKCRSVNTPRTNEVLTKNNQQQEKH